ncbi:MAG: hypothetical protein K0S39_2823, partial [Paenibacillus sp.]|nr:hypothetical protein [Paenibacillus sp.]
MKKQWIFSVMVIFLIILSLGNFPQDALAATDGITPGTLTATPMYNSISLDLPFTGDDNANAAATLQFKKTGDSIWRTGLDLWRWDDGSGRGFTGSVLLSDMGTSYEIRVAVTDPEGGGNILNISTTTRNDNIAEPSTLMPTHYVNASSGNDSNNGSTASTAWATLEKAVQAANAATGDMVIKVAPGYYAAPISTLVGNGKKITLIAQNPAVDANLNISSLSHSVVYDRYVAPTGSGDTGSLGQGGWVQTTLQGPGYAQNYSGGSVPSPVPGYTIWTRNVGSKLIHTVSYSVKYGTDYNGAKAAQPLRVGRWKRDTTVNSTLSTAAGFAETVHTNYTYNAGFWQDGSTDTLYLVLPGGVDPNNSYIWLSQDSKSSSDARSGMILDGPNLRVSGFSFRSLAHGVTLKSLAQYAVIDHNLTRNNGQGVHGRKLGTGATSRAEYATIQYNRFSDSNLWSKTDRVIPWVWIKTKFVTGDGTDYDGSNRIGEEVESDGVKAAETGANWVVRHNVFDGSFNGIGGNPYNTDRKNYNGFDIHDNTFMNLADDAVEPEGAAQNWRIWNNEMKELFSGISTDSGYGPHYVFRNTMWTIGNEGLTDNGHPVNPAKPGGGNFVKFGTADTPSVKWYVVHNTFWTNYDQASGIADSVGGGRKESWWLRNNLIRSNFYSLRMQGAAAGWNEDYNFFASNVTADPNATIGGGFKYFGTNYRSGAVTGTNSLSDYRIASGSGMNTNRIGGSDYNFVNSGDSLSGLAKLDGLLTNPGTGDLTLASGSAAIDAGIVVPNISDLSGVLYNGNAPDLGAVEASGTGASDTVPPSAPTNLTSPSKSDTTVDLSWNASTDNVGVSGYDVYRDGTKVNTSLITGTSYKATGLTAGTAYTFTVKARDAAGNESSSSNPLSVTTNGASGGTNLALNKSVTASSEDPTYVAANANDGD